MLWLQYLREEAGGKSDLPQPSLNQGGTQGLGEGMIFTVPGKM